MSSNNRRLTLPAATALACEALLRAGANHEAATALAEATVAAEAAGQPNVGFAHLVDHLEALKAGRIKGDAVPALSRPAAAIFHSDAGGGVAQLGFDMVFDDLVAAARELGIALFAQHNAYTCGALGWFASRLAAEGLVAMAASNGPALMAGSGGTTRVFSTNPLAFAAPRSSGAPFLIDQASSETAFVNVRRAAKEGRPIPSGWALDAEGRPTTDAAAAVKGALLAYGGARGANIALMVEVLAAGLTSANWSLDAPSFVSGDKSPGSGLLVIAIEPTLLDPQFVPRLDDQLHRLKENHNIHVPGETRGEAAADAACNGIDIEQALLDRLLARPIVSPSGKHPINRCLFDHRAHDLLIVHRIIISKEFSVSQSVSQTDRARPLVIPALGKIYGSLHELSETVLRVVAGAALVVHGAGKIGTPFANIEMVEGLGFYPGVFWSPLLAGTEFFGGILIALGLLTRPAALAAMIVLLVTVWFHWITLGQGYMGAEKSILWAAIFFFFAIRGANRHSLDAKLGREV